VPPNAGEVALEDALLQAFSLNSLSRMLRRHLGIVLEREVNTRQGLRYIVGDLVEAAVREQWRDDLVRGALADNSKHPLLKGAAKALNIQPAAPANGVPAAPIAVALLDAGMLEKIARDRGVSVRHQDFTKGLEALGRHMCRVEIPTDNATGTAWLVGPDLVLTNYHVIEEVQRNKVARADVTCRFDYAVDRAQGLPCGLAANWLEDWSPYAASDTHADAPEATVEEVDYALVRLARPVGNEGVGGGTTRGWLRVSATPPVVLSDDIVMVPQFPDGRSLELSFGKALSYNESATRLRYDANTEEGASGSPCVTMALQPFGLHHASGPGRRLRYNQCVPLRLVIQRLRRRGITPFWEVE
jgi:V8-like Glu-specific endopeptidase